MKPFQLLLFPLSLLYQGVLRIRNYLYDSGVFGTTQFDIPTINVGNLAFGGTGKTPHIEYLIRLLQNTKKVAVLSRGYKRKTNGYVLGNADATPFSLGDEPYQLWSKFPELTVAVCESRVLGVPNLLFDAPQTEVILLDDAFQHRAIEPGINILLTEQKRLYTSDFLAPAGYLREYRSAASRADIILVTKCDVELSREERKNIVKKIKPLAKQQIYFSYLTYDDLVPVFQAEKPSPNSRVLAFAGIANPTPFKEYLSKKFESVTLKSYPDHHLLSEVELENLLLLFKKMEGTNKILVATEKDYQKLVQSPLGDKLKGMPFYYLPIRIELFEEDKEKFQSQILQYVQSN